MRGLLTLFLFLASTTIASAAPNIVVILTDDQEDTGSMAYMPKTVLALADHGITFKNSFVDFSLCAPSRSSFMTGEAAHNDGIKSNKAARGGGWASFKREEDSDLPVWLKAAGYQTALLGKYVNGYGKGKPPHQSTIAHLEASVDKWLDLGDAADPRNEVPPGWDLWYAFASDRYFNYSINENGTMLKFGKDASDYSTDVLKDRAVRYIKDQAASQTPFFLYIATKAPHGQGDEGVKGPALASPKYEHAFADVKLPTNPAVEEKDVSDKPQDVRDTQPLQGKRGDVETSYRAELQSLQSVDDLVEAVVATLKDTGKLDNTLIVYTSDNGFLYGEHGLTGKVSVYEGSIRVPLVIKGPGVPENQTRQQLVNNLDVVATIENIAGAKPAKTPDGKSLTPLFADAAAPWRSALLVEGGNDESGAAKRYTAVRTATRKYVKYGDGFEELYDLAADPYELENKISDSGYATDLEALRGLHDRLKTCVGEGCWVQ